MKNFSTIISNVRGFGVLGPLDPSIREELDAFVAKRKEEGGAPTDF